jgi:hypothetical protein
VDGIRSALIVANDSYTDPGLSRLRAPDSDAQALARVLRDPGIGDFEVRVLLNEPAHEVNLAVEEFFADRRPDDLLLVHFSCHGVKDESGELFFAAANTRLRRLGATAVAAEFVNRRMNRSRSRRVVLLLDCCYAGAFERGMTARAGTGIGIGEQFGGRGRAVITASSAMEYAFEGDQLADTREQAPSVFTSALVEGLETGEADRDQDGLVALDELYDYVYDKVPGGHPPPDAGQMDLRCAGGAGHRPPQPSRDHAGAAAARAPGGRRQPVRRGPRRGRPGAGPPAAEPPRRPGARRQTDPRAADPGRQPRHVRRSRRRPRGPSAAANHLSVARRRPARVRRAGGP